MNILKHSYFESFSFYHCSTSIYWTEQFVYPLYLKSPIIADAVLEFSTYNHDKTKWNVSIQLKSPHFSIEKFGLPSRDKRRNNFSYCSWREVWAPASIDTMTIRLRQRALKDLTEVGIAFYNTFKITMLLLLECFTSYTCYLLANTHH